MHRSLAFSVFVLIAAPTAAAAEECRDIEFAAKRLACYDKEANFDSSMQQMAAVDLRLAQNAAETCGFVLDADKFKMTLVYQGLTWKRITDSRMYSPADLKRIGDDAMASNEQSEHEHYCASAWENFGPDTKVPGDALFKCRTQVGCR